MSFEGADLIEGTSEPSEEVYRCGGSTLDTFLRSFIRFVGFEPLFVAPYRGGTAMIYVFNYSWSEYDVGRHFESMRCNTVSTLDRIVSNVWKTVQRYRRTKERLLFSFCNSSNTLFCTVTPREKFAFKTFFKTYHTYRIFSRNANTFLHLFIRLFKNGINGFFGWLE